MCKLAFYFSLNTFGQHFLLVIVAVLMQVFIVNSRNIKSMLYDYILSFWPFNGPLYWKMKIIPGNAMPPSLIYLFTLKALSKLAKLDLPSFRYQ